MNIRHFTMALLVYSLPSLALASGVSLNKADFVSVEKSSRNGEILLSVKLSKSGKAKLKKLSRHSGERAHVALGGVESDFLVRAPIQGDQIEMGPYSEAQANLAVREMKGK